MELKGKKVLVVGLGRAGRSAVAYLARKGCRVTVTDLRDESELKEVLKRVPKEVTLELGKHRVETFVSADLVVVSPGVPQIKELRSAVEAGVRVIDEAQLALWEVRGDLIGITGTNGKSTTTVLTGKMLEATGRPLFVGGNLGNPLIDCADTEACGSRGLVVAELSSFQLQRSPEIKPKVAVCLNLDEDHLDRHADMQEYTEAKAMLFSNGSPEDWVLVNGDDEACLAMGKRSRGEILTFRDGVRVEAGGYLDGQELVVCVPGAQEFRIPSGDVAIAGRHNLKNALAACIVATLFGVKPKTMQQVLRQFEGLPHRLQKIGRCGDVTFYNDSKATNVSSAAGSLRGLSGRIVVIAGGKHKGSSYSPLREILAERCDGLVLLGEAASVMEKELGGYVRVERASTMEQAVSKAWHLAKPGSSVVLCPACSSYDMYKNYEQRGEVFIEAVHRLKREERC